MTEGRALRQGTGILDPLIFLPWYPKIYLQTSPHSHTHYRPALRSRDRALIAPRGPHSAHQPPC